jgi:hypothetical protein
MASPETLASHRDVSEKHLVAYLILMYHNTVTAVLRKNESLQQKQYCNASSNEGKYCYRMEIENVL